MRTTSVEWMKEHEIKGEKGVLLLIYVQPGASKTAIKDVYASTPPRLKIAIQAPPVDGAANEAVIAFLAKQFKIPKARVHLLSGETSRQKNVWLSGVILTQATETLAPLLTRLG